MKPEPQKLTDHVRMDNLFTRLGVGLRDCPEDRLKELNDAIPKVHGAEGDLMKNILINLCWMVEGKSLHEILEETKPPLPLPILDYQI